MQIYLLAFSAVVFAVAANAQIIAPQIAGIAGIRGIKGSIIAPNPYAGEIYADIAQPHIEKYVTPNLEYTFLKGDDLINQGIKGIGYAGIDGGIIANPYAAGIRGIGAINGIGGGIIANPYAYGIRGIGAINGISGISAINGINGIGGIGINPFIRAQYQKAIIPAQEKIIID